MSQTTVTVVAYIVVHDQTSREMTEPARDYAQARAAWNELRAQVAEGEWSTFRIEPRAMEVSQ